MPRNTFFLISGLVVICIILFILSVHILYAPEPSTQKPAVSRQPTVTVAPLALPNLILSPDTLSLTTHEQAQLAVILGTNNQEVTGVQLEVAYDKTLITDVSISPGSFR